MTENEWKVLSALAGLTHPADCCVPFAPIQWQTELDRATVRRCCRSLRRKGLAEYYRGLWSDEGIPAGAGYCITYDGLKAVGE